MPILSDGGSSQSCLNDLPAVADVCCGRRIRDQGEWMITMKIAAYRVNPSESLPAVELPVDRGRAI
jgi:hypothetical protein